MHTPPARDVPGGPNSSRPYRFESMRALPLLSICSRLSCSPFCAQSLPSATHWVSVWFLCDIYW